MAFHVKRKESLYHGLRRLVKEELGRAVRLLEHAGSSESVHAARKSVKKVRAILELAAGDLDEGADSVDALRRAGRRLAPIRDAEALLECERQLKRKVRAAAPADAWRTLEISLRRSQQRAEMAASRARTCKTAAAALRDARRSARHWHWRRVHFGSMVERIRRADRKARRAMRRAQKSGRAEDFHAWRKRAKSVWYAARLLECRVPALRRTIADLSRLDDLLGDDHNLVLFARRYLHHENGSAAHAIAHRVSEQEGRLRTRALRLGERVFRERPRDFEKRLIRLWRDQDVRSRR